MDILLQEEQCGHAEPRKESENTITYSYNNAPINGNDYVGGICGAGWDPNGELPVGIICCYNCGDITCSKNNFGGIIVLVI